MTLSNSDTTKDGRFPFGENWSKFVKTVDDAKIRLAQESLRRMLNLSTFSGLSWLDVGSGSGLFSLAARLLGARVHSFDFDPDSVASTSALRARFSPGDDQWVIEQGSILDREYLSRLGLFDVVYAWGVLHHTGSMWEALNNAADLVAPGGRLFVAIYNDQGARSKAWRMVKKMYNKLPPLIQAPYAVLVMAPRELKVIALTTLKGDPLHYFRTVATYPSYSLRGMGYWRDLLDWVGGYPFEVARPEEVFEFLQKRGMRPARFTTCLGGHGCNEFVFTHPDKES